MARKTGLSKSTIQRLSSAYSLKSHHPRGTCPPPHGWVVGRRAASPDPRLVVVTCHLPLPVCPTLDWLDWLAFLRNSVTCQPLF